MRFKAYQWLWNSRFSGDSPGPAIILSVTLSRTSPKALTRTSTERVQDMTPLFSQRTPWLLLLIQKAHLMSIPLLCSHFWKLSWAENMPLRAIRGLLPAMFAQSSEITALKTIGSLSPPTFNGSFLYTLHYTLCGIKSEDTPAKSVLWILSTI